MVVKNKNEDEIASFKHKVEVKNTVIKLEKEKAQEAVN